MKLRVEAAGITDVGCVRNNNEDSLGWDTQLGLFVVCDGMGGALAGEVASKMGVDLVLEFFSDRHVDKTADTSGAPSDLSPAGYKLARAIRFANSEIYNAGKTNSAQQGMGSTICAALIRDDNVSVAHVGDSRVYLLRGGRLYQLTQDHSLVMEQVRRGMITLEEAEQSAMQNIIIRALGSEETVEVDVQELPGFPGDVLLLATDGLTKLVKSDALQKIIETSPTIQSACEELIRAARERGGDDNITCILLRLLQG